MEKTAEQRAKARRIAENAGEDLERKREKLEWIYSQKENDDEEYLLGKAVKDELDFCRQEEKRVEDSFGSLYSQRDKKSNLQVDMTAKLREDPMAYIKKNDDDAWRQIYDNPVKMAQLRTILRPMMLKKKRKERKRKKEEGGKKSKEEDGKKKKKRKGGENEDSSDNSSSSSDSSEDQDDWKKGKTKNEVKEDRVRRRSSSSRDKKRSSNSPPKRPEGGRDYGLLKRGGLEVKVESRNCVESESFKLIERRRKEEEKKRILARKDEDHHGGRKKKSVLSEEEMEERRRQMIHDAKWRNDQRKTNVKRFEEDEKKELSKEREGISKAGHLSDSTQPDFVRPLVNDAYKSAEDRIKRNINSVQRSRADQDKNFTKR